MRTTCRALGNTEQILKRRYAKGEIDSEEYQHRLANLRR